MLAMLIYKACANLSANLTLSELLQTPLGTLSYMDSPLEVGVGAAWLLRNNPALALGSSVPARGWGKRLPSTVS
jgi:hypothetical protein